MKPTAGMPVEELNAENARRKIIAFDQCRMLLKADEATLRAAGYKSPLDVIEYAVKRIEARVQDWERNNPA